MAIFAFCGRRHIVHFETHGYARRPRHHPLYRRWIYMRSRCGNPRSTSFKNYGGRGITVCARWRKFENFLADMGPGFRPHLTLDRKRTNGPYSPSNCRWVDRIAQANNRRDSRKYRFRGRSMTIRELSNLSGVSSWLLNSRLRYGWTLKQAISEPVVKGRQWPSRRGFRAVGGKACV